MNVKKGSPEQLFRLREKNWPWNGHPLKERGGESRKKREAEKKSFLEYLGCEKKGVWEKKKQGAQKL